jgi:hypothetical protein
MKMRNLMAGVIAAGLVNGIAGTALADRMEVSISNKAGHSGVAEIKVDGPSKDAPYNEVRTETLDYYVSVRGDVPDKAGGSGFGNVEIEGGKLEAIRVDGNWTKYKIVAPYTDPWSGVAVNERISAAKLCNDRLKQTSGSSREKFLKNGVTFMHKEAYSLKFDVTYILDKWPFDEVKDYDYSERAPVKITCMPLDRPRPRTQTSTTGAPPRHGKKMPDTISEATLRIEPAQIVQDGKFLCPSQLKLYGHVEAIRKFYGKALFVGPHYLSNITVLNFQAEGNRNVTGTYTMNWHKMGGLATAPNAEPKKQKLTFHFNVANKDGKLLESVEETVEVSCKKIKVAVPTVGDEMTVKPAN